MIISHKHKLIFIKPLKVAGTSFELALRDYCGPDDIITRCTPTDEKVSLKRNKVQDQNHQNGAKYFDHIAGLDIDYDHVRHITNNDCYQVYEGFTRVYEPNSQRYYNHISARKIKKRIGEDIFNSYTKISIIRHPIDYAISSYYFFNLDSAGITFKDHAFNLPINEYDQFYEIDQKYVIDFTIKYENLESDILALEKKIPGLKGLKDRMTTFKSKVRRVKTAKDKTPGMRERPETATPRLIQNHFPIACDFLMKKFDKYCKKFNYK